MAFGARGDGQTDDSPAIRAAIAALPRGGIVEFPGGTYRLGSMISITGKADLTFASDRAVITGVGLPRFLDLKRCNNVRLQGLVFDARGGGRPPYSDVSLSDDHVPIHFSGGSNLAVIECSFRNLRTAFIKFVGAAGLQVKCCDFGSPLQQQELYLTFVEILSAGGSLEISCNRFRGAETNRNDRSPCAVSASGITGSLDISRNRAENCGRNNAGGHRLAVFDVYADAVNVTVAENVVIACREQFMRLSTTVGADIHDNTVWVAPAADRTYSTMTVESGAFPFVRQPVTRQVSIRRNRLIDPGRRQAFAVGVLAYDWGAPNQQILIEDNIIQGQGTAFVISGPFDDIEIRRNSASDVNAFVAQTLTGDVPLAAALGTESLARDREHIVEDKIIPLRVGGNAVPMSFSTHASRPFAGTVGTFYVRRNRLNGIRSGARWAISAIFGSLGKGATIIIEQNEISGFPVPFYLRAMKSARITDNKTDAKGELVETDGTVASLSLRKNLRSRTIPLTRISRQSVAPGGSALGTGCDC
jgi:hypothetical protein